MVDTRKFSQFSGPSPIQPGDIVVGLRTVAGAPVNFQFTGVGSGGGGSTSITQLVVQANHMLNPGDWVRMSATGEYVKAQADTAQHAEIAGLVILDNFVANVQFTLQIIGFVDTGIFTLMTAGDVFFLSTGTPGLMVNVDPTTDGLISLPLFIATSPTQGWIRHSRGVIVAGGVPGSSGGAIPDNPNVVAVHQVLHNLQIGQFVRLQGPVDYVPADSTSKQNSQVVGLVIATPTVNDFVLQTSGYNIGAVTQDDQGMALVPGTTYYLSASISGAIGAEPTASGLFSKPLFVSEQVGGTNAGYIYEQRPLTAAVGNSGASPWIYLGRLDAANNFSSTTILQDENGNTFRAYEIIVHAGDNVALSYGIRGTGAGPVGIGFRFYVNGGFVSTPGNYASYLSGVNSSAGVNTATNWAYVANSGLGVGRDYAVVLPRTSTDVGLGAGQASLTTTLNGGSILSGQFVAFDIATSPGATIGYTCDGWAGGGSDGANYPTGMQVYFDNGVLTPGSPAYILVYGIPNS
jgi:hypothetical protein